jgi:uncharacterized Ntn-hydrolase superfamily protein
MVLWAESGVGAVATQSWPNLYLAIDALRLLRAGSNAKDALATVLEPDPDAGLRQLGVVDAHGRSAAWSGDACTDWCGHVTGDGFAAQGNMLLNAETVDELGRVFSQTDELDLSERLLRSLEAAQAAGGDKRGKQCSALLVVDTEEFALWDLRVDEHPNPVAELRRIYEIACLQLLPFVTGLPTRDNPRGSLTNDFIATNVLPPPLRPGGGGAGPTQLTPTTRPTHEEIVR